MLTNWLNKNNKARPIILLLQILVCIYIFINPFPHKTAIELACFYFSVILFFFLAASRNFKIYIKTPLFIPFTLFTVWAFIGLFFALDNRNSIHDFYAHLIQYLILYLIIINAFLSESRLVLLFWVTSISAFVFSSYVLIDFYWISENPLLVSGGGMNRLGLLYPDMEFNPGFISYTTMFGLFMSLVLIARKSRENVLSLHNAAVVLMSVVLAAASFLTQSRAMVAGALASLFVFALRSGKVAIAAIALVVIGVVITPGFGDRLSVLALKTEPRIGGYLTSVEVIKDHPVMGIGFGMQTYGDARFLDLKKYNERVAPEYRQKYEGGIVIGSPHSTYLDIAIRTGLVGLLLWLWVLVAALRMAYQTAVKGIDPDSRKTGLLLMAYLIAISVQNMFTDGMFGPQVVILYTLFALITISWRLGEGRACQEPGSPE